jgi:hypothetical protein
LQQEAPSGAFVTSFVSPVRENKAIRFTGGSLLRSSYFIHGIFLISKRKISEKF